MRTKLKTQAQVLFFGLEKGGTDVRLFPRFRPEEHCNAGTLILSQGQAKGEHGRVAQW